jgi:hypothetical protein
MTAYIEITVPTTVEEISSPHAVSKEKSRRRPGCHSQQPRAD